MTTRRGPMGLTLVVALVVLYLGAAPAGAQTPEGPRVVSLEEALGLALRNNRDLQDAVLAMEGARHQVREAWSSVFPSLDMTAGYTRNLAVPANFLPRIIFDPDAGPDELVAVRFGADNAWSFMLRAEQPLFQAGAFIGVGAADRYRELQREVVRGRATDIAMRVKVAYYDALLGEESARLAENTVERISQTLDETRKMHRAGLSSNYDVLRLEVELANVEPVLRRSRNAAAAALRNLAIELGLPELDSVQVRGSLGAFDLNELVATADAGGTFVRRVDDQGLLVAAASPEALSQERALDVARENRSDLRQLALTERLRQIELRVEQAEYLPKVTLFGSYTVNAQQNGAPTFFGSSSDERAVGRQVGVQVSMPLFSGFRRPARIEQQRVVIAQVAAQRRLLEDRVENEVKTVLEQAEEARTRAAAQRFALQQANRGFQIASAQYREGISSQLEVTDAEVALRQSEFNYAEAVYDYLVARARLDRALGMAPPIEGGARIATGSEIRE